jgi:large subunit ribosomal protein L4
MDIKVYNQKGTAAGTQNVSDLLFAAVANADLVYQVATSQMSNSRKILAHAKTRAEVRGGGKKPWRQKGTGRARHGSIRSPIWIGGGVAHGPSKDVNFKKKVNVAAARKALAMILSSRVTEGHMLVVDALDFSTGKTKDAVKAMNAITKNFKDFKAGSRVLLAITGSKDDAMTRRAVNNLPNVDTYRASDLNALTVLSYPYVVTTKDAVAAMEKSFSMTK